MPSATSVVDLTGDDDEPLSRGLTRPQQFAHPPGGTQGNSNSSVKRVKPSPSKKKQVAAPQIARDGAGLSFSQSSVSKQLQTNGSAKSSFATPSSQNGQRPPKPSLHVQSDPPLDPPHPKGRSPKRNPKPMVVSNDSIPGKAISKAPRGYDPGNPQRLQDRKVRAGSFDGMNNSRKRALDAEDGGSQDRPQKKLKVDSSSKLRDPASNRTDALLGEARRRSLERERFTCYRGGGTDIVDLTFSPPPRSPSRREAEDSMSPRKEASRGSVPITLSRDIQNHASKLVQDVRENGRTTELLSSQDSLSKTVKSLGTETRSKPAKSNESGRSSPRRHQDSGFLINGAATKSASSTNQEDSAERERSSTRQPKQTEKAKELGINRDRSTSMNGQAKTPPKAPSMNGLSDSGADFASGIATPNNRSQPEEQPVRSPVEPSTSDTPAREGPTALTSTVPNGNAPGPAHAYGQHELTSTKSKDSSVETTKPSVKDVASSAAREERSISIPPDKESAAKNSKAIDANTSKNKTAAQPVPKAVRNAQRADSPAKNSTTTSASSSNPTQKSTSRQDQAPFAAEADLQLRTEANTVQAEAPMQKPTESFLMPSLAASTTQSSVWSQMPLESRIEKVLGQYLEEMRSDNEYWTGHYLEQARLSKEGARAVERARCSAPPPVKATSFTQLRPIAFSPWQRKTANAVNGQVWKFEMMGPNDKGMGVVAKTAQCTPFRTDTPDVPNYSHYVSIKTNILTPNVANLYCWPYFGDDFDGDEQNLKEQYNLDINYREEKLLLMQQAQKYEPYVESALQSLDCTWADVLRFLIEEKPKRDLVHNGKKSAQNRKDDAQRKAELDNFSPTSARSIAILNSLPPSTTEELDRVRILCTNFEQKAKFDLWHIARRSKFLKRDYSDESTDGGRESIDGEITCRICLRFNCPYHGELNERLDDESDPDSSVGARAADATDIVNPPNVNYRTRVEFPSDLSEPGMAIVDFREKMKKRDANYWKKDSLYRNADERGPFYPCHHPGKTCEGAECTCFEQGRPCEKTCACAPNCERRFQGCSCARRSQRCFNDLDCPCFAIGRECDPDLCGACGVCEVVDPINRDDDSILHGRCRNGNIQRGVAKQTLLGDSGIHGLGLYACEDIQEHDFVGEYKGEIITKEEAERRGAVYEHQKLSYLFSLNKTQEIDSTNFGNQVRFINHASGHKANLYPRIIMVNTVHRIALYAASNIKAGQELFFDYGPMFPDEQLGGIKKSKKSAPHVRNANLVKSFVDVEESEDEVGNLRAKAVNRSALGATGRAKLKKQRGGARAGAGRKPAHGARPTHDGHDSSGEFQRDAGERLAFYNISDEPPFEPMDVDRIDDAEDDEDEYRDDEEDDDDVSEDSEATDGVEEDYEEVDDGFEGMRGLGRRNGVVTRGVMR